MMAWYYPADIYLFKVNNGNTKIICKIYSKSTIKTTVFHFYTPWKRQETKGFLTFSGDIEMEPFLLTLNKFHTLFWCFHCWLWTIKYGMRLELSSYSTSSAQHHRHVCLLNYERIPKGEHYAWISRTFPEAF